MLVEIREHIENSVNIRFSKEYEVMPLLMSVQLKA